MPGLSCLAPLLLGVMLLGCGTSATLPPEPSPQPSPGPSLAADTPLAVETDSVAPDEANSIYFATGAARVDRFGEQKLRLHAARLKANPAQMVTLAGYTDDMGSRSYNLVMAEQRIDAVARLLRSYGVAKKQIHPVRRYGRGPGQQGLPCRTAVCRQKMRRVELIYSP